MTHSHIGDQYYLDVKIKWYRKDRLTYDFWNLITLRNSDFSFPHLEDEYRSGTCD